MLSMAWGDTSIHLNKAPRIQLLGSTQGNTPAAKPERVWGKTNKMDGGEYHKET